MIPTRIVHILVVDDVLLMCDFLYKVISAIPNCKVLKATDGRTALEILGSEPIDMLITDIEMKAPNGLELLKKLRCGALKTPHNIPVLMFSGNTYKDMVLESHAYDINDFLAKPVSADGLKKKVLFHLQNEKSVRSAEYYQKIVYIPEKKEIKATEAVPPAEQYRSSVAIVRSAPTQEQKGYIPTSDTELGSETESLALITWPANSSTGFHQLDRRMLILAQRINSFHNLVLRDCKAIALAAESKRICEAIDYLIFVGEKLKLTVNDQSPFWVYYDERTARLAQLRLELERINPRYKSQLNQWLKQIANWWVQTISRPFVHFTDESGNLE